MTFFAAGAAIVGSLISADGAQSAADTQAGAARDATAAQERMFERQIQLQEPWRQAGVQGLNRLGYLMGLSPTGFSSTSSSSAPVSQETEAQIRARLSPQFTTSSPDRYTYSGDNDTPTAVPGSQTVDTAGLNAAVQAALAQQAAQQQQQQQQQQTTQTDPLYGSLLKSFTTADFQKDPGYEFRLGEGQKALQRAASAMGGAGSGKYMKDAMAYNQGFASNEYQNAYNRFNSDNTNKFNRLASLAGIGQTSANAMGNAASNFGSQIGSNIIGAGNAAAAGQVGAANAINGGISQGISMYQQGQLMNKLFPGGGTPYNAWSGSPMSNLFYGNGSLGD